MPLSRDQRRRQRSTANASASTVFKYGGSEVTGRDSSDDVLVYYWSAPHKSVHNTSEDFEQLKWTSVTTGQQHQQQMHLLSTSSFRESSVHSAAVVLTIAGTRRLFTASTFASPCYNKVKVKERIVLSEIHLRTSGRHLSMVLHQCYLPPDRGDRPAFTPTGQVGTRLIDSVRMKG